MKPSHINQLRHLIKSLVRHPLQFFQMLCSAPYVKSDLNSWREKSDLEKDWDSRTIQIAGLIPADSDVLEFGAGRLVLINHLPPNCSYQSSDIIDSGEGTIVCDLNDGFPNLPRTYTHTIFSGVLEYIDVEPVIYQLKNYTDYIITSYTTTDKLSDYITRRRHGWISHLSNNQLLALFHGQNYDLKSLHSWCYQSIYVFKKTN